MISVDGGRKMPCEGCGVQFSVFRRKRACPECGRQYCAACLRRGGGMCAPCRALTTRPVARATVCSLKARDLQCFLHRQNVSTRGCVEKEELVSLCISHVNGPGFRRRGASGSWRGSGPFSTLKLLTADINNFFVSTFDPRPPASPQPRAQPTHECYNAAHAHAAPPPASSPAQPPPPPRYERFTTTPGGEHDIRVPPPESGGEARASRSPSVDTGPRLDTADCFEVEDLDDGWELLNPCAEPLPGDSEVLMTANVRSRSELFAEAPPRPEPCEQARPSAPLASSEPSQPTSPRALQADPPLAARLLPGPSTPQRASSELELPRSESANTADSTSLQDEPIMGYENGEQFTESSELAAFTDTSSPLPGSRSAVSLEALPNEAALEALSVRQLKELLMRNRVEYRGCLERGELLARARTLYREYSKYGDAVEALPIEECCKICMAAPLECVLLECGHIAACTACSKQLADCPICRQYVVRAVRFFRS